MLKVGDKTILDWLVDDIDSSGLVDEYVVISNHKYAAHFEGWASEKPQRITIVDYGTNSNGTRLAAVRDICYAIDSLGLDDDMLVIAGDNVLDFSLRSFIAWLAGRAPVYAMEMPGRRFDIGNLESYAEVRQEYSGIKNPYRPISQHGNQALFLFDNGYRKNLLKP